MIYISGEHKTAYADFTDNAPDWNVSCLSAYRNMMIFGARVSAMPYNTAWPGRQRPLEQTEVVSAVSI